MDNVTIEDLEALRADNRGDVLTIYQQGNRREKEVSIKDYIMSKIKELDRYGYCFDNELTTIPDGDYVMFDDLVKMFGGD